MERDKRQYSDTHDGYVYPDQTTDAALDWFALLQGYPDDKELRSRFEEWRKADPANAAAFEKVAGIWELPELDVIASGMAATLGKKRNRGVHGISAVWSGRSRGARAGILAVAALLLIAGVQQYPAFMLYLKADYLTATGAFEEVTLPDGSRMMLNTASAVSLDFEGGKRAVTLLEGEAFFDVVSDPERPFTVAANFARVEVKGTAFAVRTDSDEDRILLERGVVEVSRNVPDGDMVMLAPGEGVTATGSRLSGVSEADTAAMLAWREGRLIFQDRPFGQVIEEIGRYYPHSVFMANAEVARARVTGNYRLENPERTIRSLAATVGASVTRLPGGIIILR